MNSMVNGDYLAKRQIMIENAKLKQGFDGYCSRNFFRKSMNKQHKTPPVGAYNPEIKYKVPVLRVYSKEKTQSRSQIC